MFWWHCGNVEGKRLLVVCMKGTFDVCLFVADGWLIFFFHQPILNLVEILFSYHHMVSNISALTSTTSTTTTMTMTMITNSHLNASIDHQNGHHLTLTCPTTPNGRLSLNMLSHGGGSSRGLRRVMS